MLAALGSGASRAATFGGGITGVTDYIFRGISWNDGNPAAQLDLHVAANSGLFAGVWASTLDRGAGRSKLELELYAGKRFVLSTDWSATLTATDYNYLRGSTLGYLAYQEISASFSYLDIWNFSLTASPNTPRYWERSSLGRHPAYDADVSMQWPLFGPAYLTAGAGYYYLTGPSGNRAGMPGYAYGNAGIALERSAWRLDVGYYFADAQAEYLFPYAGSTRRVAAALSWRF